MNPFRNVPAVVCAAGALFFLGVAGISWSQLMTWMVEHARHPS